MREMTDEQREMYAGVAASAEYMRTNADKPNFDFDPDIITDLGDYDTDDPEPYWR